MEAAEMADGLATMSPVANTAATWETYQPENVPPHNPSLDEQRTLNDVLQRVKTIDDELYELHGIWYQISLFKHGLQYTIYNYADGFPYYQADVPDGLVRAVYNIMQAVQNQTMSYFLDSPPRYTVRSLTEDGEDIEKSKTGGQILKHFETNQSVRGLRSEVANWLTTHGNAVIYQGWDPTKGDTWQGWTPQGWVSRPTGNWVTEVVPPYQIVPDPEAKHPREMRFVIRRRRMSRDWLVEAFPEQAPHVQDTQSPGEIAAVYELAWLSLSARHGFSARSENYMPHGRNSVWIYEMWEKPSVYHPQGRYIIIANDNVLLYAGPNPYGRELPFSFFRFIPIEGSFWARSTLLDLMYLQMEINRRESQKSEHCNLLGNPPLFHWNGDGLDEDNLSNIVGQIIGLNPEMYPAVPFFLKMPELSMTVREMVPEAMRFVDFISGNFGPSRGETMSSVKSGVQQMMVEEADARNMRNYMNDWEEAWEHVYKLALMNFQRFGALQHKIKVLGSNNQWRLRYVQGTDLTEDTDVEIVPGSTFPTAGSTTFTKMLALLQAGAFNLMDPADNQRFWEALDMSDMVRFVSDKKLDREKAFRNIERIRQGQRAMYDPVGDDPQVHLDVVNSFKKSAAFELAPQHVKLLALLYQSEILAPLQAAMRMPTAPDGFPIFGGEAGAGPGGPQVPEVTQVGEVGAGGFPGAGVPNNAPMVPQAA
jgi:hypothetical protein